jgi:hypothetical protein
MMVLCLWAFDVVALARIGRLASLVVYSCLVHQYYHVGKKYENSFRTSIHKRRGSLAWFLSLNVQPRVGYLQEVSWRRNPKDIPIHIGTFGRSRQALQFSRLSFKLLENTFGESSPSKVRLQKCFRLPPTYGMIELALVRYQVRFRATRLSLPASDISSAFLATKIYM